MLHKKINVIYAVVYHELIQDIDVVPGYYYRKPETFQVTRFFTTKEEADAFISGCIDFSLMKGKKTMNTNLRNVFRVREIHIQNDHMIENNSIIYYSSLFPEEDLFCSQDISRFIENLRVFKTKKEAESYQQGFMSLQQSNTSYDATLKLVIYSKEINL
jgi:hypothetical protein